MGLVAVICGWVVFMGCLQWLFELSPGRTLGFVGLGLFLIGVFMG